MPSFILRVSSQLVQCIFIILFRDRSIIFWNSTDYSLIQQINAAHDSDINCMKIITNNVFASGSNDNTIKLWDVSYRVLIRTITVHTGAVNAFGTRSNSEIFLSAAADFLVNYNSINNCVPGQFFLHACTPCSSSCLTCFEANTNCLTCATNRITPPICGCNTNYYELNGNCNLCLNKCNTCSSATNCLTCKGDRTGTDCTCASGYDDLVS